MTSRGVRLAILASRGQLDRNFENKPEFNALLTYFKIQGLDFEIDANLSTSLMLTYASLKNDKMVEDNKKQLLKVYFPEAKDPTEVLLEEAKRKLEKDKNPVMRLGIESNKSISPEAVNAILKNKNKV